MPRKPSPILTEAEQRVMQALWELEEASVRDVHDRLNGIKKVAYTTVLTVLKILHEKGYADYRKEGRAFIYYPLMSQKEAQQRALRQLVSRFFGGSPQALAEQLVELDEIDLQDLQALKKEIDQAT